MAIKKSKKRKRILLALAILALFLFYYFYLDYYLFQFRLKCNFNPVHQTITEDGDKFYYTCKNEDFLLLLSTHYTVYYYSNGRWTQILECYGNGGGYGISYNKVYKEKNYIIYKISPFSKKASAYFYKMVDKSNNKCVDLDSAIYSAEHMTSEQIRKDAVFNKARGFFENYGFPDDDFPQEDEHEDFDKIKRAFEEK